LLYFVDKKVVGVFVRFSLDASSSHVIVYIEGTIIFRLLFFYYIQLKTPYPLFLVSLHFTIVG
jgi:hypothetical protein